MSAISALFLAACSEYGLSKIDTGEFAPPEQDSAITPPEPTDTAEPQVETDAPSDSGMTPYDTGIPDIPEITLEDALACLIGNIGEENCVQNTETATVDSTCVANLVSSDEFASQIEATLPYGNTYQDLLDGNVPITAYLWRTQIDTSLDNYRHMGEMTLTFGDNVAAIEELREEIGNNLRYVTPFNRVYCSAGDVVSPPLVIEPSLIEDVETKNEFIEAGYSGPLLSNFLYGRYYSSGDTNQIIINGAGYNNNSWPADIYNIDPAMTENETDNQQIQDIVNGYLDSQPDQDLTDGAVFIYQP